jgi:hypothetical protein
LFKEIPNFARPKGKALDDIRAAPAENPHPRERHPGDP